VKKRSKNIWASPYKMATCWSLLCKYGNFKPFYPHDVVVPGAKILLDILDFLYFLSHFVRCLQLHIFASLSIFHIFLHHFHLYCILVSQYVIFIGISFQSFFHFSHIFPTFPTFVSHILLSFSIFPIEPCHKKFCLL